MTMRSFQWAVMGLHCALIMCVMLACYVFELKKPIHHYYRWKQKHSQLLLLQHQLHADSHEPIVSVPTAAMQFAMIQRASIETHNHIVKMDQTQNDAHLVAQASFKSMVNFLNALTSANTAVAIDRFTLQKNTVDMHFTLKSS
jgi:hypothetical protein